MILQFKPDTEAGNVLYDWWKGLEDNKGDRAALRRCNKIAEVLFVPAYHELCFKLRQYGPRMERLPAVAGLLVHVEKLDDKKTLPQQMANPKVADGPSILSKLRFQRLLQCQSQEELFPMLRRVVRLLGGTADIYSLANGVYYWGDKTRKDWAYAYYKSTQ